jgi:hypothetical protein
MNALITWFDQEFTLLESDWCVLIEQLDEAGLYSEKQQQLCPAAEQILQSARIVEQVSGGITANLWDDPFEWTLPETLTTREKLISYFAEVSTARAHAFEFFADDTDLRKTVMAPRGPTQLISLLLDALVRARHHRLQAKDHLRTTEALN